MSTWESSAHSLPIEVFLEPGEGCGLEKRAVNTCQLNHWTSGERRRWRGRSSRTVWILITKRLLSTHYAPQACTLSFNLQKSFLIQLYVSSQLFIWLMFMSYFLIRVNIGTQKFYLLSPCIYTITLSLSPATLPVLPLSLKLLLSRSIIMWHKYACMCHS